MSDNYTGMTFEAAMDLRFEMCLKRLVKLRELNAPVQLIVKELAMLVERCTLRYGGELLWASIGRSFEARARRAAGFCPGCKGEIRRLQNDGKDCAECEAETARSYDSLFGTKPDTEACAAENDT